MNGQEDKIVQEKEPVLKIEVEKGHKPVSLSTYFEFRIN